MLSRLTLKTSVFNPQQLTSVCFVIFKTVFRSLPSVDSRAYNNSISQISPLVESLVFYERLFPGTLLTAVVTNFSVAIYLPRCFCFTKITQLSQQQILKKVAQ